MVFLNGVKIKDEQDYNHFDFKKILESEEFPEYVKEKFANEKAIKAAVLTRLPFLKYRRFGSAAKTRSKDIPLSL